MKARAPEEYREFAFRQMPMGEGNEWIKRVQDREPGFNRIVLIP